MTYFRSFIINFLFVFFIDRVAPGVQILNYESVPEIGADILFSALVGFCNASVFPILSLSGVKITKLKIAVLTFLISFAAFGIISAVSFGIEVVNPVGFFVGGFFVWIVAFFSNYLEWKNAT